MLIGFIGKEYEFIKSWKVNSDKFGEEFTIIQPMGTLMVEVYTGSISNNSFFEALVNKYGLGMFEPLIYVEEVINSSNSNKSMITKAYKECRNIFDNIIQLFRAAITHCLEVGELKDLKNKTLEERLHLYIQNFRNEGSILIYSNGLNISFEMLPHEGSNVFVETYEHMNFGSILFVELKEMVLRNVSIKKCKNCNKYFPVTTRTDTEFCPDIAEGETKPCNSIGATRKYHEKFKSDQLNIIYKRGYAIRHSRVLKGVMSNESLKQWMLDAKAKMLEVKDNELSLIDFELWTKIN